MAYIIGNIIINGNLLLSKHSRRRSNYTFTNTHNILCEKYAIQFLDKDTSTLVKILQIVIQ